MSGIYIPGMAMPTGCDNCYFLGEMGICSALLATHRESGLVGDWRWNEFERPPHCPLVPVPDHGDLIDRDVVREMIDVMWTAFVLTEYEEIFEICDGEIMAAPVIIPAEEGEG